MTEAAESEKFVDGPAFTVDLKVGPVRIGSAATSMNRSGVRRRRARFDGRLPATGKADRTPRALRLGRKPVTLSTQASLSFECLLAPYNTRGNRDATNATDNIYNSETLLTLKSASSGYTTSITLGVQA